MLGLSNLAVNDVYVGAQKASAVFLGDKPVWQSRVKFGALGVGDYQGPTNTPVKVFNLDDVITPVLGDNVVIVFVGWRLTNSGRPTTSVTYDGVPMVKWYTPKYSVPFGNGSMSFGFDLFYLYYPSIGGPKNIAAVVDWGINISNATPQGWAFLECTTYSGVKQMATAATGTSNSTTHVITAPVAPVNSMVQFWHNKGAIGGIYSSYDQTERVRKLGTAGNTWIVGDAEGTGATITSTAKAPSATNFWIAGYVMLRAVPE